MALRANAYGLKMILYVLKTGILEEYFLVWPEECGDHSCGDQVPCFYPCGGGGGGGG